MVKGKRKKLKKQSAMNTSQALWRNVTIDEWRNRRWVLWLKEKAVSNEGKREKGDGEEMVLPRENSQVEEDQNDEGDQSWEEVIFYENTLLNIEYLSRSK